MKVNEAKNRYPIRSKEKQSRQQFVQSHIEIGILHL